MPCAADPGRGSGLDCTVVVFESATWFFDVLRGEGLPASLDHGDPPHIDRTETGQPVLADERARSEEFGGKSCLVQIFGPGLGRQIPLDRDTVTIGREYDSDVVLRLEAVSRHHCAFTSRAGRVHLRDLRSTNGTFLNDHHLGSHEEVELRTGDHVQIGPVIFKFLYGGDVEALYHEEIYQTSVLDPLTQLYTRRYFFELVARELARSLRHGRPFSVILLDVDHFKSINECFGHLGGDFVLRELARLVSAQVRREDCTARYGGEAFSIASTENDLEHTLLFAEKLRGIVEAHRFEYRDERIPVTVSIGVASVAESMRASADLIGAADERLYEAKRLGRNQVVS